MMSKTKGCGKQQKFQMTYEIAWSTDIAVFLVSSGNYCSGSLIMLFMKNKTHTKAWMVLLASIGFQFGALAQNLVVNGGFDSNVTGWSSTNNPIGGYECCKGNPGGFCGLDSTPSATTDPTVSQVITGLVPGVSYMVSGDYEKLIDRGGGSPTGLSFGVAIDGAFLYESPQSNFAWHSFAFSFVATSPSVTLSISAQRNGTGVAYAIDNIVMQRTPQVAAKIAPPNIVLSWPTNAPGFRLQSATDFTAASWSDVTNIPALDGDNYSVTLSPSQGRCFFRLIK